MGYVNAAATGFGVGAGTSVASSALSPLVSKLPIGPDVPEGWGGHELPSAVSRWNAVTGDITDRFVGGVGAVVNEAVSPVGDGVSQDLGTTFFGGAVSGGEGQTKPVHSAG